VWIGACVWTVRIVYEETLLSWRSGPQMIGFSWSHTFGVPFLYCWLAGHVLIAYLAIRILWVRNARAARRMQWPVGMILLVLVVSPMWIPSSVLLRWTMELRRDPRILTGRRARGLADRLGLSAS
jgi:hypothetical protein